MKKSHSRPKWAVLFLMILPVLILFWLEAGDTVSREYHEIAEISLVLLLYGIIAVWLKANESAISMEQYQDQKLLGSASHTPMQADIDGTNQLSELKQR